MTKALTLCLLACAHDDGAGVDSQDTDPVISDTDTDADADTDAEQRLTIDCTAVDKAVAPLVSVPAPPIDEMPNDAYQVLFDYTIPSGNPPDAMHVHGWLSDEWLAFWDELAALGQPVSTIGREYYDGDVQTTETGQAIGHCFDGGSFNGVTIGWVTPEITLIAR